MSISMRVNDYLQGHDIHYSLVKHPLSENAIRAAQFTQLPPEVVAKAVVLEDHDNHHILAILPASCHIDLHKLGKELHGDLHLVDKSQLSTMFEGCASGAVPAIVQAYNIDAIYDERLKRVSDVYFEAGDNETLIHLSQSEFVKLMANIKHGQFSNDTLH